jgi:hypothetical protein
MFSSGDGAQEGEQVLPAPSSSCSFVLVSGVQVGTSAPVEWAPLTLCSKRLEVVVNHILANMAPEGRAFLVRVTEVEACQDSRPVYVQDHVAKVVVLARRVGGSAVE